MLTNLWLAYPSPCVADSLDESVHRMLTEAAKGMQQITVEYQLQRRTDMPHDALFTAIRKSAMPEFFKPNTYRFTLQGNKWLKQYHIWMSPDGKLDDFENKCCFDGSLLYGTNLKERGTVTIQDQRYLEAGNPLKDNFGYSYYLYDAGYSVSNKSIVTWEPVVSMILLQLEEGGELLRQELKAPNRFEIELHAGELRHRYLLDLSKGGAVVEHDEMTDKDELISSTRNSKFKQIGGLQLWLPMHCEMACYTWISAPNFISKSILAMKN